DVPGGKGCNQAVACARLSGTAGATVAFLGQFGNDPAAETLRAALVDNGVDASPSGRSTRHPSGRGYVTVVPDTGEVSAVVSGGSNRYGWGRWAKSLRDDDDDDDAILTDEEIDDAVAPHSLLMLQCEVPSEVNLRLATAAQRTGAIVLMDAGGEDRPADRKLLEKCDYLIPNETELRRLAGRCGGAGRDDRPLEMTRETEEIQRELGPSVDLSSVLSSAATLQRNGARDVLVTLGGRGSLLVRTRSGEAGGVGPSAIYCPPCPLPANSKAVDDTGAGDCYRAAFAVALLERRGADAGRDDSSQEEVLRECMEFASAAGALAVTREGAVPSVPSREEAEDLLAEVRRERREGRAAAEGSEGPDAASEAIPRGGGVVAEDEGDDEEDDDDGDFPLLFGSRLNSMKDRPDLADPSLHPLASPREYVRRQARIRGLGCVDFNYPQHFDGHWTPAEAKEALDEAGLVAGAVCLRYPAKFARGAMTHPDPAMRREAVELTKAAADAAKVLGCDEVVVWSAYDGYDYPFQVEYEEKWDAIVAAFRECCDAHPDVKWSLEYKPTDENTRFFAVPSTGAAILLVREVDRPNMGLTLDVGHMLMSGENPGQSIAMAGRRAPLFGVQLNDGYTRLAAEDGLMFGSVHPSMALEAMYQLRKVGFEGHLYFDTFPQRTDPVKEAEWNIRRAKELWRAAGRMDPEEVARAAREHDAVGALELVEDALRRR
ncbi:hypothetical protein ACHAWF_002227, partial [Thalassiosira exigua]